MRGEFNVPLGTKTAVMLPTDDFERTAKQLSRATITASDFEPIIDKATRGDFIFIDPPYTVCHNQNGFIKYNERIFSWEDQVRLRDAVARAARRGAKALVLNADHESIRKLYSGLGKISPIGRHSVIAGSAKHRRATSELLIRAYGR